MTRYIDKQLRVDARGPTPRWAGSRRRAWT